MKYISILSLLVFVLNCEKQKPTKITEEKEQNKSFYAVNIFSAGKVTLNSQEFKYGSILKENETLVLEPKSICDLQLFKEENVIRLRGKNQFKIERSFLEDNTVATKLSLEQGIALIRIDKKLSKKEKFEIVTSALVLGVRGTNFKVQVEPNQTNKVSVYEGNVTIKLQAQKEDGKSIQEFLDQGEILVSGGDALQLDQTTIANLFKNKTPEKLKQSLKEIQNKFVKPIPVKEIQDAKNELKELIPISADSFNDDVNLKNSIASRIDSLETDLLNRMAEVDTKKKGFIVLSNDKKIQGYIKQEKGIYFIETPKGTLSFPESEVFEVNY
jgi:hypothetical protein